MIDRGERWSPVVQATIIVETTADADVAAVIQSVQEVIVASRQMQLQPDLHISSAPIGESSKTVTMQERVQVRPPSAGRMLPSPLAESSLSNAPLQAQEASHCLHWARTRR